MILRLLILILCVPAYAAEPPIGSWQHRKEMQRSAWRVFGPSAPVATLAAQIHQESGWRINAVSPSGAQGFAQFMPMTAKDMAARFPAECSPANPFDENWAYRCRDRMMSSLLKEVKTQGTGKCDEWGFGFKAYNGGGTWVKRDRKLAIERGLNPDNWIEVNKVNAGRKPSAFKENSEYPVRIFKLEKVYAGWGQQLRCL